jgi:hypothetical protein
MTSKAEHRLSDIITARIFGQYLTMPRSEWQCLRDELKPSESALSTYRHVVSVCERDAD